ncbi:hypothetical protein [Cryobacterium sp. Hb1]|uniref:YobI family P-loop NTPase n=1 Tax=Cryobacterium sp. Hb1 TaxID=1259147 RepID=UPI00106A48D8|nr:hypothetical protein [Cryobacterium sp. Hb1]TFD65586.1 hypothetical protein E3T38_14195 [Cryobacterium sp. Hb1]
MTNIELRSLAPEYVSENHQSYVARLNAAVKDPRNKNIALTGRYGAGKSSILDRFLQEQEQKPKKRWRKWPTADQEPSRRALRISINTLGPDDGEDLTNRIQKELVKQLVYRAEPGKLRTSRFARKPELKLWRAAIDAFAVTAVIVGLLWLFGVRPDPSSFGTDTEWFTMLVFTLLVFVSCWVLRWVLGRRTVSQFSTGGASIAFEEKTDSYFDKYLDELVAFFEATEPDLVIFEDLDRFSDPQIFDSLRELNTLVNASSHWQGRADRPVRFIYAIKDSLFEKLGNERSEKDAAGKEGGDGNGVEPGNHLDASGAFTAPPRIPKNDAAAIAVERANRTKFFEIVIPVVPFLSHSNARDLFGDVLEGLNLPAGTVISRGLIDIVARHTTDMRLMINIGNEFVVYAERLLWIPRPAPGMTADDLFALVVYKNFHLADFEALPHRGSTLDDLEQARRELIKASIATLQNERAALASGETRRRETERMAVLLGERLNTMMTSVSVVLTAATSEGTPLSLASLSTPAFWRPVAESGNLYLAYRHLGNHQAVDTLDRSKLQLMFGNLTSPELWEEPMSVSDDERRAEIDLEIPSLRGVSFKDLAGDARYILDGKSFGKIVEETLSSRLAVDLVKQGYLDRYYAEYATVFYGNFLGVDVANFFRNSVWPNEIETHFHFTTENAVANVMEQAPSDFLRTRSALNIEIVDHVVNQQTEESLQFVDYLTKQDNADTHAFLTTYLNTPGSRRDELVSLLAAKPWPELFNVLAMEGIVADDESLVGLLNAALLSSSETGAYKLNDAARALIANLHAEISAFTLPQPGASPDTLFWFIAESRLIVPSIRALSEELQGRAVTAHQYELTANNIRAATPLDDTAAISADNVIRESKVWEYCAVQVDHYLGLVAADEFTTASCLTPEVLAEIVESQSEAWTAEQLATFLLASSPAAALPDIAVLQRRSWGAVVAADRVVPNVPNLTAYVEAVGVDSVLAALLVNSEGDVVNVLGIEDSTAEELKPLIIATLNASQVFTPSQRARLTNQLMTSPAAPELDVTEINATPDDLLRELLQSRLLPDNAATFEHFSAAGWPSIGPALKVSTNAPTFISPLLTSGHASDALHDAQFSRETKLAILANLEDFSRIEDSQFVTTAAEVARQLGVVLSTDDLELIAPLVRNPEDLLWQLRQKGASLAVSTIMELLARVPGDFVGFAGRSGDEFVVSETPSLAVILDRLRRGNAIEFPRGRPQGRRKVRLA